MNILGKFAPWAAILICSALVVFQAALALGAPLGRAAWGGQYTTLPTGYRIGSVVAMAVYAFLVLCILRLWGKKSPISPKIAHKSVKIFGYFLILGVLMNALSRSHTEAIIMAPSALILCISMLYCAYRLGPPKTKTTTTS